MAVQQLRPQQIFSQFQMAQPMQSSMQPSMGYGDEQQQQQVFGPDPSIFEPQPTIASRVPQQQFGPDPSIFEIPQQDWRGPSADMGGTGGVYDPAIHGGPQRPSGVAPSPSYQDMADAMNQIYTPSTIDRDRNRRLLDEAPVRKEPSGFRKVMAGIGAMKGGPEYADKYLYGKGNRELEDWKTKTVPFGQAAQYENTANNTERALAGNMVASKTAADTQASRERIAEEKNRVTEENNKAKAENDRIRAMAYSYSQRLGKGWDWDLSGPTLKKFNKTTGEAIDTGLPTGKMSEELRIELQNEGRIEAARVTGEAAAGRIDQAGWNTVQYADGTIVEENVRTGEKRVYPPGSRTASPDATIPKGTGNRIAAPRAPGATGGTLETRRVEQDKMKDLYEIDPVARGQMTFKNGTYSMKTRPVVGQGGFFGYGGATQEDVNAWDAVKKELDPSYVPPQPKTEAAPAPSTPTPAPATKPAPIGPTAAPTNTGARNQLPGRPPTSSWGVTPPEPKYNVEQQQGNPREQRRSTDGKTFEYSHDGGKTWGRQ